MVQATELMLKNLSTDEEQELRVLELIEQKEKLTQRGIAAELQIAIGLANSLIKRLTHKGFIKIKQIPSRRYAYYLTSEGFFEKSRLVSKYIANSVHFLGEVRQNYEDIASNLRSAGQYEVGCIGRGEILEIAQMVFRRHNIEVLFVVDVIAPQEPHTFESLSDVPEDMKRRVKSLILTEPERPHKAFSIITEESPHISILHPAFMKIPQNHRTGNAINTSSDREIP